jgi:two-component system, LytTR family, response regulator
MKAAIIEDEPRTSDVIADLLGKYCPDVTLCGRADDFRSGYALMTREKPSLVFMDIQLNSAEGTGLDLCNSLQGQRCAVIFITGHKDYAAEAFRLEAVDYLLKPVRISHLVEAVERAKRYLGSSPNEVPESASPQKAAFHIPTQNGFRIVRPASIVRCEADGAYTHFFINGSGTERVTSSMNIGQVEKQLNSTFLRVHRSHLINRDYVSGYSKSDGLLVRMSDGFEVPVARSARDTFFGWLD